MYTFTRIHTNCINTWTSTGLFILLAKLILVCSNEELVVEKNL